jgi:predicted esterase
MALTLSLVIPDYLAGVVAIRGYLPDLQSWPIEALEMDNLPVLLMRDPEDSGFPGSFADEAARQLSAHGAQVSVQEVPGAHTLGRGVGPVLHSWLRSYGALDGKAQR